MRKESEILADLAKLCATPGYVHAIAALCFRDNLVMFSGQMKPEHMRHMFSESRLIRTEIATLIGYLIKNDIDYTLPSQATLSSFVEQSDVLLKELHDSMTSKILSSFDPSKIGDPTFNPLNTGEA